MPQEGGDRDWFLVFKVYSGFKKSRFQNHLDFLSCLFCGIGWKHAMLTRACKLSHMNEKNYFRVRVTHREISYLHVKRAVGEMNGSQNTVMEFVLQAPLCDRGQSSAQLITQSRQENR